MFNNSLKTIVVSGTILLTACTTDVLTSFGTPAAFNSLSYCQSVDRQKALDIPANIETLLSEETSIAQEEEIANAMLIKAALEIAHKSTDKQSCETIFREGESLFRRVLQDKQKTLKLAGGFKPAKDATLFDVQTNITRLWREDQSARGAYMRLNTNDRIGKEYWASRLSAAHATRIDAESKSYIESLLEQYDWIDRKRFGGVISDHAWILVQHADDHPEFQAKVLSLMEPYLKSGDVSPKNYAYLWDRVAVNTGQKQRYGTQPTWDCQDGALKLQPLEDPANVNKRRANMGLNTVEESLETMARQVCG